LASPPPAQQKLAITISALPEETTTVIIEARVEGLGGTEAAASGTLGLG
jgi:DNA-directed RNA polymerase specialized sigma24 family protein